MVLAIGGGLVLLRADEIDGGYGLGEVNREHICCTIRHQVDTVSDCAFNYRKKTFMTNGQVRMLSASITMFAGAVASLSNSLDVNLSIVIILLSGAIFLGEWFRSFKA